MDLVLAVLILGVAEVVVLGLAFRALDRQDDRRPAAHAPRAGMREGLAPGRFFADTPGRPSDQPSLEALLEQLERHVRLEHAAAESFLHNPTAESLHYRTASPLHLAN